ncbi:MAG: amidohydrolase, partial [Gammaproteobacteria bacterium]|nr:amidohydrolase [Gammaproteobacteria bacterium]
MKPFYLIQANPQWEAPDANRDYLAALIENCRDGIVVLPEMFSTGFSMASKRLAETMAGETVSWMTIQAKRLQSVICGSQIIEAEGQYYNRFIWAEPDGSFRHYDKRHLFRMADEQKYYAAGQSRSVVEHGDLVVLPQICYDLRFPAWSRNTGNDFHAMIYVANWPAARRQHWLTLLKARAIENICYVVAVNRVGVDGNDVAYDGDSCVIDFRGETLLDLGSEEAVANCKLDIPALTAYREAFPA